MKNEIRKENPDCVVRAALLALGVMLSGGAVLGDAVAADGDAAKPHAVLELTASKERPRVGDGAFLRLKDGRILFVYDQSITSASGDHDPSVVMARTSADEGETWSEPRVFLANDGKMNQGSCSLLRLDEKRIANFYLRKNSTSDCTVRMRVSSDEGETWTESRSCMADAVVDYYVMNNARARRLKSGRILLPIVRHHNANLRTNWLSFLWSDDNGETWKHGGEFEMRDEAGSLVTTQEPGVEELVDGRVYLYVRTDRGRYWHAYSKDGGETWGDIGPAPFYGPLCPATIKRLQDGKLLLIWNDHEGRHHLSHSGNWGIGVRSPLTLAVSQDEGKTWTKRRILEGDMKIPHFCYFDAIEVKGGLLVSYHTFLKHGRPMLIGARITKVPYEFLDLDRDDYDDGFLSVSDTVPACQVAGTRRIYAFTNSSAVAKVTLKRNATLEEFLVVGGGGGGSGGGATFGCGGNGGEVVHSNLSHRMAAGETLSVKVGAGGWGARAASSGRGEAGDPSKLNFGKVSVTVQGGIGGSIGRGRRGTRDWGGGGDGALTAGQQTHGGEGVTNRITGAAVVYGSGGGGGTRSTITTGGDGGTNAGAGGHAANGGDGASGTGAGGGGSGFKANSSKFGGGRGGSGTVILVFK